MRAQIGDTVKFRYKNHILEGTINRFRIHTRRKLKQMAQRFGIVNRVDAEIEVAEIAVIGKGLYTVPITDIRSIVGSDPKTADEAKTYANNLKANNNAIRSERRNQSYEWAKEHGLLPIGPGALVWVRYKTGAKQETFLGLTANWNVKIGNLFAERTISPKFVATDLKLFTKT